MTPDELERCRCMGCGKPVDQWLEVYVCRHVRDPSIYGDAETHELGAKVATLMMCSRCVALQFSLPDPLPAETKPS
jgi:hypothetical protein